MSVVYLALLKENYYCKKCHLLLTNAESLRLIVLIYLLITAIADSGPDIRKLLESIIPWQSFAHKVLFPSRTLKYDSINN